MADLSVAESIFLAHEPRRGPLLDLDRMYRESAALLARLGHEGIPVRARRWAAAPRRAADRLDRPRALGRRPAADHGRAVRDPRRRRDRDALRGRAPAHRRGRRRRLHLAPPRRDPHASATASPCSPTGGRRRPASRRRRRPDELVELMVGRKVEQLYPDAAGRHRPRLLEVRGLKRLPDVRGVEPRGARRRGRGSRRARRARAAPSCSASSTGSTRRTRARCSSRASGCGRTGPGLAIRRGLGLAPEDRKSQALVLDWSETKNVTIADLRRFSRLLLDVRTERRTAQRAAAGAEDGPRRSRPRRPPALGRQPAEGRARPLAAARVPRPAARRADARRRRRDEGRDLPHHQRPRRRRASACWSSRPSSRSSSASARASSSCATARSSPRSTGSSPPSASCSATPWPRPTPPS